jgi:molybdopterin converting factor small subunit
VSRTVSDASGDTGGVSGTDGGTGGISVRVRYFAGARAAAGTQQESVALCGEATVAGLIEVLTDRHGGHLAQVLAASTFLIDEVAGGPERVLRDRTQIDVLPPFAGG